MMRKTALAAATALVIAAGCSDDSSYVYEEPATVDEVSADLWRVELTEQAVVRTGIEMTSVAVETVDGEDMLVVPYSTVMYHFDGSTWVYTSPEPRVYLRAPIEVDHISEGRAVLVSGPEPGTDVVMVGAAELYGVEFGIGK